jgi:hypothetical protein
VIRLIILPSSFIWLAEPETQQPWPWIPAISALTRVHSPSKTGANALNDAQRSSLVGCATLSLSRARTVGARNAIEVRFNAKNEIAKLIVVSELASSDECALVVCIAEAQAEESVGQITLAPGSAEVGADVESSPTERRRQID